MSEFVDQLRKFVVDNNIVGTSAGVCIALATKDGIQSLVGDIIIPGLVILLHSLHIDSLTKILPIHGKAQFNIMDFIKQFITWILIIIISFVFVKFAFEYLLGISNNKNDVAKPDVAKTDDKKGISNNMNNDNMNNDFSENFFTR
jgi:large-conductance mechanosensitive channel